jgi:hypothetical protein
MSIMTGRYPLEEEGIMSEPLGIIYARTVFSWNVLLPKMVYVGDLESEG